MDIKKVTFQSIGLDGKDKLNELYNGSALAIEGCSSMKDDDDALEFFAKFVDDKCGGWDESKSPVFYDVSGKVMDELYGLHGTNAYPDDLNIVLIPLEFFAQTGKLAVARFAFEGRWFDDVIDNNARRENDQGYCGVTQIA